MDSFRTGSGTGISESELKEATALSIAQYVFLTIATMRAFHTLHIFYKSISIGYIYYGMPMSDIKLLIGLGIINAWTEFLIMLYFMSLAISFLIFYGITHWFVSPLPEKDYVKLSWKGFVIYFFFVLFSSGSFIDVPGDQLKGLYPMSKVVIYLTESITAGVLGGMVLAKIINLVAKPLLRGYVVMLGVTLDNPKKRRFVLMKRKSNAIVEAAEEFWGKERDWLH